MIMKQIAFGVHMPVIGFSSGEKDFLSRKQILSFAQKAEFLGYDSLSVNDHIVFRTSWLDAISTLSAVAAITNKIKLGTSILNIVIRNPVVCAKALSAIDILSSGRLFAAGVGPGSYKGDYDVCGIPFEERWKRFTEALQILRMVWDDEEKNEEEEEGENRDKSSSSSLVDHNGIFYRFDKVSVEPKPFQRPHPPIFIGSWGSSEIGLRRVAKYGDGWMASAYNITPNKFKEKWKTLLSYRRELGKDTESFENSVMSMFGYIDNDREKVHKMAKDILSPALRRPPEELENLLLFGSTEQSLQKIKALCEAGVKRIHFWPVSDYQEQIEIFSKEIVSNC
jgi:alkanesulfonate monooxygenase SsuD/methylene tetrahydromethanopterin reductase-like flavin-dependent oxidoreductase (luciferase family)